MTRKLFKGFSVDIRIPRLTVNLDKAMVYISLTFILIITILLRILPTRFGFYISEFDPYLQLYATKVIVKGVEENGLAGLMSFFTHHIDKTWYPEGVDLGARYYPGVPYFGALTYLLLRSLGISVSVESVALWLPVVTAVITVLASYYLGKMIKGEFTGILSALLLSISPAFIPRSIAGWYDTECLGMPTFILSILFFSSAIRARERRKSALFSVLAGLMGGIMGASWGAFSYLIVLYSIFPFIAVISKLELSENYKLSHIITLTLMLMIVNAVPRNRLNFTVSIIAVLAYVSIIFVLLTEYIKTINFSNILRSIIAAAAVIIIVSLAAGLVGFGVSGKYITVVNPFYRTEAVFVTTVQEQTVVNVGAFLYHLNILIPFLIFGVYLLLKDIDMYKLLLLIMLISTLYAASSFARLFIMAAPIVAIVSSYSIDYLISVFHMKPIGKRKFDERQARTYLLVLVILLVIVFSIFNYSFGIQYAANIPPTIASASTQLSRNVDDWLEALAWIRDNVPEDAVIAAWWDYGYWISFIANRTSLADNGTLNLTRIKLLATMFLSNETEALSILKKLHADYVLIFIGTQELEFGGYYTLTGLGEDSKFIQMARIAGFSIDKFIYSAEERVKERKPLYKDAFWNTFLGKLIPYRYVITQVDPRSGRLIDIYEYSPKYPPAGNAPLTLVFRSSHHVVGEVLIYKINYDYQG